MFVICPEGNGIDTHRINILNYTNNKNKINFIKKAKIPVLILKKWSDLSKFDEKQLQKFYFSKKKLFNNRYLSKTIGKKELHIIVQKNLLIHLIQL